MKKLVLTLVAFICSFVAYSQQSQVNYLEIVAISAQYTIINNVYQPAPLYQPDYNSIENAMAAKQAQYDNAFGRLQAEFRKQQKLKLVNTYNRNVLETNQGTIKTWAAANFSRIDITNSKNFSQIYDYFTWVYKNESIINELKLLNSINSEMLRIKTNDPNGFYRSNRYFEIKAALDELAQCDPGKINSIAWKYGFV